MMDTREYLERILYTRSEVDAWLAGKAYRFEKYDGELGWVLHSGRIKDGVDGSICTYTFEESGSRRMMLYRDEPCRINTYGNSFTQCHQVNDGETWQEMLAAHLGEPVRNYGIGGYSVYQSCLRLKREEVRTPAEYILFGIFTDDHYRSLPGWRNIRSRLAQGTRGPALMGISPSLPHVKANPATGEFEEYPNPCPTPDSVYNLCDLDWVYETFKNDFTLRIMVARANVEAGTPELSYDSVEALADEYGLVASVDSSEKLSQTLTALHDSVAHYATMRIVDRVVEWAAVNDRKVLCILSHSMARVASRVKKGARPDRDFVAHLDRKRIPYVDLLEAHAEDFGQYNLSVEDYLQRYFIGHYNPHGNFFTALATKNRLVAMLEPRPRSYQLAGFPSDPQIAFDYGL